MNLKKLALALAVLTTVGGSSAFAAGLGISTPLGGVSVGTGLGYGNGLGYGTAINQGLAPVYTDRFGAPLYAYPGLTQNQIISEPAVLETAPLVRPHRHWFDLDFFGHGIFLGRHARRCETVNSLPAMIESCPQACPQVISQPAVCQPQTAMEKITTTTTTYRTLRRVLPRVIKRHNVCQRRTHTCGQ